MLNAVLMIVMIGIIALVVAKLSASWRPVDIAASAGGSLQLKHELLKKAGINTRVRTIDIEGAQIALTGLSPHSNRGPAALEVRSDDYERAFQLVNKQGVPFQQKSTKKQAVTI